MSSLSGTPGQCLELLRALPRISVFDDKLDELCAIEDQVSAVLLEAGVLARMEESGLLEQLVDLMDERAVAAGLVEDPDAAPPSTAVVSVEAERLETDHVLERREIKREELSVAPGQHTFDRVVITLTGAAPVHRGTITITVDDHVSAVALPQHGAPSTSFTAQSTPHHDTGAGPASIGAHQTPASSEIISRGKDPVVKREINAGMSDMIYWEDYEDAYSSDSDERSAPFIGLSSGPGRATPPSDIQPGRLASMPWIPTPDPYAHLFSHEQGPVASGSHPWTHASIPAAPMGAPTLNRALYPPSFIAQACPRPRLVPPTPLGAPLMEPKHGVQTQDGRHTHSKKKSRKNKAKAEWKAKAKAADMLRRKIRFGEPDDKHETDDGHGAK